MKQVTPHSSLTTNCVTLTCDVTLVVCISGAWFALRIQDSLGPSWDSSCHMYHVQFSNRLLTMPIFRRTFELGICVRRSLVNVHLIHPQVMPNQTLTRSIHRLLPVKCKPFTPNGRLNRNCLPPIHGPGVGVPDKCSNRFYFFYRMLMSSSIKERIYDNLILFTRILHKQSNVYLCLRLRRLGQICNLYRRIYSPHDFKNLFIDRIIERLMQFSILLRQRSSHLQSLFYRHRVLLSFASLGFFSWDENRITDQELQDLMKEFMFIENSQEKSVGENQNETYCKADYNGDQSKKSLSDESSFMVVNCLQATHQSTDNWEEVINQPNFHVWRKSVNNTSLYEYKGMQNPWYHVAHVVLIKTNLIFCVQFLVLFLIYLLMLSTLSSEISNFVSNGTSWYSSWT